MKKLCKIFALLFLALLFPLGISAYEGVTHDTAEEAGVYELPSNEYITESEAAGDSKINIANKAFTVLKDSISSVWKSAVEAFCALLATVLLVSLFSSFKPASGMHLNQALEFASVLAVSGITFAFLKSVFSFAAERIDTLCNYMTSLLPVSASLYAAGGNAGAGAASTAGLIAFLSVVENIVGRWLFPLLQCGFVMSLVAALPSAASFRSLASFFKNLMTSLLAFVFSIFGLVLYFQTVIASSADNYAFRSVKFASGTLIPVIGSMIGDAARTVYASAGIIKGTVGAMGIVVLLSMLLPPLVYTVAYKLVVLSAAMISAALGCEKESKLLYDLNSIVAILIAMLVGTGVVFIIAISLFIRLGVTE